MSKESIIKEFRLKNVDETRSYFVEEIEQNELMSKNFCMTLIYEQILVLASVGTRCISVSAFAYLVGIPVGNTSSAAGLNIFAITTRIKEYKSINQ